MIDEIEPLKLRNGATYSYLTHFPDNEDNNYRILGVYSYDRINWMHIWHNEQGSYSADGWCEESASYFSQFDLMPSEETCKFLIHCSQ